MDEEDGEEDDVEVCDGGIESGGKAPREAHDEVSAANNNNNVLVTTHHYQKPCLLTNSWDASTCPTTRTSTTWFPSWSS